MKVQPANLPEHTEPLDPEEIVNRIIDLQANLKRAEDLCEQANKKFAEYRNEIQRLKARNDQLEKTVNSNEQEFSAKLCGSTLRRNPIQEPVGALSELRHARRQLDEERLKRIEANHQALTFEEHVVRRDLEIRAFKETKLRDLEPRSKSLEQLALLPSQPFVVMLIDGDSYKVKHLGLSRLKRLNPVKFSSSLCKGGHDAGISIAQALWLELSKHILSSDRIPPHSKIVVRIFYNGRHMLGPRVANNMRQYTQMEETMIKFAETQPLFDFLDCGGGKERADDKIKGMYDLSLFCCNYSNKVFRKRTPLHWKQ